MTAKKNKTTKKKTPSANYYIIEQFDGRTCIHMCNSRLQTEETIIELLKSKNVEEVEELSDFESISNEDNLFYHTNLLVIKGKNYPVTIYSVDVKVEE